jgi:hypothetical protein
MRGSLSVVLKREEFRRHLMAFVLTTVLVWYTFVSVPCATAPRPREEEPGGEVRPAGLRRETSDEETPVEELDWPEFIGLDLEAYGE